jgi:NAD(P)-dependent dehydrogenase (short-subunit alcohol dehydrogenase family)
MPAISGHVDFNPAKDIPSLEGKVILITGGTAGLGRESILTISRHNPSHIYFTGRNTDAATSLTAEVHEAGPSVGLTFLQMDMASLTSIKTALASFTHARLDILMLNAGIMAHPPGLSKDGFEIQFAINHLGNALVLRHLLPILSRTAEQQPGTDVRVVCLTSLGWRGHPRGGILFDQLRTPMDRLFGSWVRYGQSKMANIVTAREVARRYPEILAVSVHPGVVETELVTKLTPVRKGFVYLANWVQGIGLMKPEQGCLSQIWVATAGRGEIVNGGFYTPVGVLRDDMLDKDARDPELAKRLWDWTEEVLSKI